MPRWLNSFRVLPRLCFPNALSILAVLLVVNPAAFAQEDARPSSDDAVDQVVSYKPSFFDRYQPNTALDMVQQVPGFRLNDGADRRGFGATSGNILINDRYPSSKQDTPSQILARIPAGQVELIEVIRSQIRKIDLRGRPVVVNLVLTESVKATTRWDLAVRKNFTLSPLAPVGSISVSDRWGGLDVNIGLDGRKSSYGDPGTEFVFDGSGNMFEERIDDHDGSGYNANAYINGSTWIGETLLQFNSTLGLEIRDEILDRQWTRQSEEGETTGNDVFVTERNNQKFEFGIDAERKLSSNWIGKGILLYQRLDQEPSSTEWNFDEDGNQTLFQQAETRAHGTESIARVEFDWVGAPHHVVQINFEVARNTLDSGLVLIVDDNDDEGPVVEPVSGANTRVEEERADLLISDTWSFGNLEFDYGIGAETSTISQTGDVQIERDFFFIKPHATLTYAKSPQRQQRLHLAREVSQLDFKDFVSTTVFLDNDLALGNPNLKPEATWILEASEERRFGTLGVVKLTAFHHWISDVEDLLPIEPDFEPPDPDDLFEVPGNIGDGRRWGLELETTLPLGGIGLRSARLDVKTRWQDSTVVDPVTGEDRVLSAEGGHAGDIQFRNENEYSFLVDFRQDFEDARFAWGWDYASRADRPLFKVNELDVYDETAEANLFVETTRWLGMKIRLTATNVLEEVESRDRTEYVGERELTLVDEQKIRDTTNGFRLTLEFSGAF
jgi:hypothetical protein